MRLFIRTLELEINKLLVAHISDQQHRHASSVIDRPPLPAQQIGKACHAKLSAHFPYAKQRHGTERKIEPVLLEHMRADHTPRGIYPRRQSKKRQGGAEFLNNSARH